MNGDDDEAIYDEHPHVCHNVQYVPPNIRALMVGADVRLVEELSSYFRRLVRDANYEYLSQKRDAVRDYEEISRASSARVPKIAYAGLGVGGSGSFVLKARTRVNDVQMMAVKYIPVDITDHNQLFLVANEYETHRLMSATWKRERLFPGITYVGEWNKCDAPTVYAQLKASSVPDQLLKKVTRHRTVMVFPVEMGAESLFTTFTKNNPDTAWWRDMLFKILFTMANMAEYEPAFRHNDCHTSNWVLTRSPNNMSSSFFVDDQEFVLTPSLFDPALIDFGLAYHPRVYGDRPYATHQNSGTGSDTDYYYDIHTLFNALVMLSERYHMPDEVIAACKAIVPRPLRVPICSNFGRFNIAQHPVGTESHRLYMSRAMRRDIAAFYLKTLPFFEPLRRCHATNRPTACRWIARSMQ